MKIAFSTKHVSRASFLDTCQYAYEYGYAGFEIYDAVKERKQHHDSILRSDRVPDSKRKLVNRNLTVSALVYPYSIDREEANGDEIVKYVDMARSAGIERIILRLEEKVSDEVLSEKLAKAIKCAEEADIQILFETAGYLAETENVIDIINL